jgi:demethylmenaquinone methyltransferase/2-methoxy-6-polyprenyl-1,4-benzoquinol methylase
MECMATEVKPYESGRSKKEEVAEMFDNISGNYDFLNHFLSAGIDKRWRKRVLALARNANPKQILDVATGTADQALALLSVGADKILGVDISEGMLEVGRKKIQSKGLQEKVELRYGDSEALPFDDACFDLVTVSFGVRNFQDLKLGLREINRVLRPHGEAIVLEFSHPRKFPIKQAYGFYSRYWLPAVGRLISKDRRAYTYLPESVEAFPSGEKFKTVLLECGFQEVDVYPLSFGIASIYHAKKYTGKKSVDKK